MNDKAIIARFDVLKKRVSRLERDKKYLVKIIENNIVQNQELVKYMSGNF